MYSKLFLLIGIFYATFADSQTQIVKTINHVNQIWFGYFNQIRLHEKWGIWTDLQLRTKEDFINNFSQSIIRIGGTYYFTERTRLTGGYAYVANYPGDNHANVTQPEHRLWQLIQWQTRFPKVQLNQAIRIEERFKHKIGNNELLAEGYDYFWKVRYSFLVNLPLNKKAFRANTFSLVASDEVHLNFGKEIVYNYFDQNRFFIGIGYYTGAANIIQFGYMNQFQQLSAGNSFKNTDIIRVLYFHNIDLRKRKVY